MTPTAPGIYRSRTSEGDLLLETHRGSVIVRPRGPGIAELVMAGVATVELARPSLEWFDVAVAEGKRVTLALDTAQLESYESEFRVAWTKWLQDQRAQIDDVLMLVTSPVVRMGVAITNRITNDSITTFRHRRDYDAALQQALARAR